MSALGPHMQGPYLDPNSGRYYYCNMQTMRSEWAPEQPAPLPGQAPGQMPQYAAYPGYPGYPAYYPGAYPAAAYVPQPQPAVAAGTAAATSPTDGREICGDFKRGMCTRGDTCKYSHNVAGGTSATGAVQQQQPGGFGREECADYKRGLCNRGATCRYVHVEGFAGGGFNIGKEECGDFKRGVCFRGERCRYSHDIPGMTGGGGAPERRSPSRRRSRSRSRSRR